METNKAFMTYQERIDTAEAEVARLEKIVTIQQEQIKRLYDSRNAEGILKLKAEAERDEARAACAEKDKLIADCQNDLMEYLIPDSGVNESECISHLLARLDGPQSRHALSSDCGKDYVPLGQFWNDLAQWSQSVFGTDTERGPIGPLKHLALEVNEALASPQDVTEYADCFILVCDAARRAGFTLDVLFGAVNAKHATNKTRTYPRPVGDEPSEHIKGGKAGRNAKPLICPKCGHGSYLNHTHVCR